jgi:hypothetical protein
VGAAGAWWWFSFLALATEKMRSVGTNWLKQPSESPTCIIPSTLNHQLSTVAWQPAITVKPDGTKLFIAWYDRRNDPSSNSLIQTYGTFANLPVTDTNSFTTNFLISTAQFQPVFSGTNTTAQMFDPVYPPIYTNGHPNYCGSFDGAYSHHMGDYDLAFADNNFVYYSWFDGRNTCTNSGVVRHQGDIRFIRLSWPR